MNAVTADDWTAFEGVASSYTNFLAPPKEVTVPERDQCSQAWLVTRTIVPPPITRLIIASVSPTPKWLNEFVEKINQILSLKDDWDSYGAPQISRESLLPIMQVLSAVMTDKTSAPAVVPTSDGGIQLEWHQNGLDFEIESAPNGELTVFVEDESEEFPVVEKAIESNNPQDISFLQQISQAIISRSLG
jgi:hypothetical protein